MKGKLLAALAVVAAVIGLWLVFGPRTPQTAAEAPTASASARSRAGATGGPVAATMPGGSVPADIPGEGQDPSAPLPVVSTTTLPAGQWTGSEPTSVPSGAAAQWRPVAAAFARDLADARSGWAARLGRWCTPEYAQTLTYADPRTQAPQGPWTGSLVVAGESSTMVDVTASYAGGESVVIRLVMVSAGWRVASLAPAPQGPAQGVMAPWGGGVCAGQGW